MNLNKFLTDFLEEKEEKKDKKEPEGEKKAKGWECTKDGCGGRLLKDFKTGGKWCTKCKTKYPK